MLSLLEGLESAFGPFRLFGYTSFRCAGAMATGFVLMLALMPPLIRWLKRKRVGEQGPKNDGAKVVDESRAIKAGTPTMGGLGLIACILAAALAWCRPTATQTWMLMLPLIGFGLLGFLDDRTKVFRGAQGLNKWSKLGLQVGLGLACGMLVWAFDSEAVITAIAPLRNADGSWRWTIAATKVLHGEISLPFVPLSYALPLGCGLVLWTIIVTFACANSVNFTDGLDGLASGTMLVAALAYMVIAYLASHFVAAHYLGIFHVPGCEEAAVFCAATAGGCLGFLWFNAYPAQVFMGDTGSQALGGSLAMVSLLTKQEFLILIVGFVFFLEGASVLLQVAYFRSTGGRRLFRCAPIHHHFQYLGWPETRIVLRFWILAVMAALLALATLKLR